MKHFHGNASLASYNQPFTGLLDFFLGFSIPANLKKLFNTTPPNTSGGHLGCLNGIRFFSMTWVLLSHAYGMFQFQIPPADAVNLARVTP